MLVLIASPEGSFSGKTTVAAGLGQRFQQSGRSVSLLRLSGDDGAAADAAFFHSLPFSAASAGQPLQPDILTQAHGSEAVALVELPAGYSPTGEGLPGYRAVIVVRYGQGMAERVASYSGGSAFSELCGVIVTRVPLRRLEACQEELSRAGLPVLALLLEDRLLAAPTGADLITALNASTVSGDDLAQDVLDRVYVSSISADPAQEYALRLNPSAVIVRSDKPDQQLGVINAGVRCLIITGEVPLLPYVLERAQEEDISLILTRLKTVEVVQRLESLVGAVRFGGAAKTQKVASLLTQDIAERVLASR
ncbi:MAG TPA: DRTGG domain-containing protein [Dehalococcoidia bacterium]|nr:DRTGG domain-containing protein [Dehalococcoidia bacterium]